MLCDHAGFRHEASILPFELHVLEVAIGDVCQLCSGLVKELEISGHPILDTLVKHVRPAFPARQSCPPQFISAMTCAHKLNNAPGGYLTPLRGSEACSAGHVR